MPWVQPERYSKAIYPFFLACIGLHHSRSLPPPPPFDSANWGRNVKTMKNASHRDTPPRRLHLDPRYSQSQGPEVSRHAHRARRIPGTSIATRAAARCNRNESNDLYSLQPPFRGSRAEEGSAPAPRSLAPPLPRLPCRANGISCPCFSHPRVER